MLVEHQMFYVTIGLNATVFFNRLRIHVVGPAPANSNLKVINPNNLLIRNTINNVANADIITVTQLNTVYTFLSTLGYTGAAPSATAYQRGQAVSSADLAALTTLFTYNGWGNQAVTLALLGGPIS